MKTKPFLPPTCLLIALIGMLILHFTFPVAQIVPLPWDLLGMIPLVAGIFLNFLADRLFHQAGTTVKPFQKSSVLITQGVFRISRHPMYLGFVLILAGVAILLGSLTPWVIVPVFIVLVEIIYIRVEEHMLAERFGPAWMEFKKKVRRWL
jgi:protein-S-isoprenylcysteine O-methyltransferase Ste14